MMTKQPSIALSIDEAEPGTFYWVLTTLKDNGKPQQLKAAQEPADSYEAALAAGTRALRALIHERESASA